jgi:hypothetical protein
MANVPCPGPITRRGLIKSSIAASLGYVLGRNFIPAAWAADDPKDKTKGATAASGYVAAKGKAKNVILLWMSGGPSHVDTFDPQPGKAESGGVKAVEAAAGLQISEKLSNLAKMGQHLCVLRGVTSKEGDHGQASHLMHTGYREQSGVEFPGLGSIVAAEAKDGPQSELPSYVAINSGGWTPGFYGAQYGPFSIGAGGSIPDLLPQQGGKSNGDGRRKLLDLLDNHYAGQTGAPLATEHRQTYQRAIKLSNSPLAKIFELKGDDQTKSQKYGTGGFAKACYVAKQLVTKGGVRFVEIGQGGWDTHNKNDEATKKLCDEIDNPFAKLLEDLNAEGALSSTLVIWMGEFGRTPNINKDGGRDHYPRCFSVCLAGGGVKGGQAVGKSTPGGHEPDGTAITVPNMFYSICEAAGIDPTKIRESADGRPIPMVDRGSKPVAGIFG